MTKINWQQISFLPQISTMINGMLDAAKETYEPLCQIKVHDDHTIRGSGSEAVIRRKVAYNSLIYSDNLSSIFRLKSLYGFGVGIATEQFFTLRLFNFPETSSALPFKSFLGLFAHPPRKVQQG